MEKEFIQVKKIHSSIGRNKDQHKTLLGLGLKKIGQKKILKNSSSTMGMIKKVSHLIEIL
jgi:large subunit ribosomal protein L30